jgi:hypothetical protein
VIHVHGVANTEAEFDISALARVDSSHYATNLDLLPSGEPSVLFNKALEVDTKAVEADFSPGKFGQGCAFLILSISRVNPESDLRARVHDRRGNVVKDRSVLSAVVNGAVGRKGWRHAPQGLDLLSDLVVVQHGHLV